MRIITALVILVLSASLVPAVFGSPSPETTSPPTVSTGGLYQSSNVQFNESYLPSETAWTVTATGVAPDGTYVTQSLSTNTNTILFASYFMNGTTVKYTVAPSSTGAKTYKPSPSSGSVLMNGSNNYVTIVFNPEAGYLFTVNVVDNRGIDYGLPWTGFLTNNLSYYQSIKTAATSISFAIPNGTYYFQMNGSKGVYEPTVGSTYFTIVGNNFTLQEFLNDVYVNQTYYISFRAYGISNGTAWTLTFNGSSYYYTQNNVSIPVRVGYNYSVEANASGYTFKGPYSVYIYTFNQQINIEFQKNGSGSTGYLQQFLGFFGLTEASVLDLVFLIISLASALITFALSKSIEFASVLPMIIMWMAYSFVLHAFGPYQVFFGIIPTLIGLAAVIANHKYGTLAESAV